MLQVNIGVQNERGVIGKPILGLLTFGNAGFWRLKGPTTSISFDFFEYLAASTAKYRKKEAGIA